MKKEQINIRDPFVLPFDGRYYLYGTRGETCWGEADGFDCYISTDLIDWSGPIEVFHKPKGFWANRNYWAPEVYYYQEAFYMLVSFKSKRKHRGTQILKSGSPIGPFYLYSDGSVTPKDWECLDGTLYIDSEGVPYMVFCHEWTQIQDGEICAMELSKDLKSAVGFAWTLFKASEASWVVPAIDKVNFVTDGPFLYRCKDGALLLLWSSFEKEGYTQAVAKSSNNEITGNWLQQELLFERDGGHGMVFQSFDGRLILVLHSPNEKLKEHPQFYELTDRNNKLFMK